MTDTPEELDQGFMDVILRPVSETVDLVTEVATYEEQIWAKTKMAKEKKEEPTEMLKAAEALEKEEKWKEAIEQYDKILKKDPKHKVAKQRKMQAQVNSRQSNMFAGGIPTAPVTSTAAVVSSVLTKANRKTKKSSSSGITW